MKQEYLEYGVDFTVEQIGMRKGRDPRIHYPKCSKCGLDVIRPYVRLSIYTITGTQRTIGRLCYDCFRKLGLGDLLE